MILTVTSLKKANISIEALDLVIPPFQTIATQVDDVTKELIEELGKFVDAGHITYATAEDPDTPDDLEPAMLSLLSNVTVVSMLDAADVGGGGTTQTVGFELRNLAGQKISAQMVLSFGAFAEADAVNPHATATLNTAAKGTILGGAASNVLTVKTDASGEFECTLTNSADDAVYLAAAQTFRSPLVHTTGYDSVTFSA